MIWNQLWQFYTTKNPINCDISLRKPIPVVLMSKFNWFCITRNMKNLRMHSKFYGVSIQRGIRAKTYYLNHIHHLMRELVIGIERNTGFSLNYQVSDNILPMAVYVLQNRITLVWVINVGREILLEWMHIFRKIIFFVSPSIRAESSRQLLWVPSWYFAYSIYSVSSHHRHYFLVDADIDVS